MNKFLAAEFYKVKVNRLADCDASSLKHIVSSITGSSSKHLKDAMTIVKLINMRLAKVTLIFTHGTTFENKRKTTLLPELGGDFLTVFLSVAPVMVRCIYLLKIAPNNAPVEIQRLNYRPWKKVVASCFRQKVSKL